MVTIVLCSPFIRLQHMMYFTGLDSSLHQWWWVLQWFIDQRIHSQSGHINHLWDTISDKPEVDVEERRGFRWDCLFDFETLAQLGSHEEHHL